MHIRPIVSTLRRHRTTATLIILEIALTCAIVCNAIFLIRDRLSRLDQPSGLNENELVRVQVVSLDKTGQAALTRQDLQSLRAIPGVRYAACTNMLPFSSSSWTTNSRSEAIFSLKAVRRCPSWSCRSRAILRRSSSCEVTRRFSRAIFCSSAAVLSAISARRAAFASASSRVLSSTRISISS